MKYIILFTLLLTSLLNAEDLKIKANSFKADENTGISVFSGDVGIVKKNDELNASEVTIYVNKEKQPIKFVALGNVSFTIETKQGAIYNGVAGKVIYLPNKKEYHFFKNVHLRQTDVKKEIIGEEVVLKTTEGKAYAKGVKSEPVIMIFNIPDEETKE
ncbi:MAG: lipopolysaccharide transport periplasmic protein LptA [Spirochaetaceae bacterium 4572_7]|nr:MAG: lipopolysaccharide transport periplasmic protein LptA [Spirochaetaceae bacterium 4572_7]